MKRLPLQKQFKQVALAMPVAALMLGAAHAGTSVGINFSATYYGGGGYASQVVTDMAFGIGAADWFNTSLDDTNDMLTVTPSSGGSFGVAWTAAGSNISWANSDPGGDMPGYIGYPGDGTVYYGNLTGPYAITLSGLAAQFPNGYAVQVFSAANNPATNMLSITVSDGVITNTADFVVRNQFMYGGGFGTALAGVYGYYLPTASAFTSDTLVINQTNTDTATINQSWISGFIITDKPIVSVPPIDTSLVAGNALSLTTSVVGVPPLYYQWRTNGVPIPGANSLTYAKAGVTGADAGNYDLVATNNSGSITSAVAVVNVAVPATLTWDADTGTAGTQDGDGTWDSTTANWWNGTSDAAWSPYSFATFGSGGGGAYTVTLNNSVSASGLTFNNGNYTIANATGAETITMAGSQGIAYNNDTEIDVPLAGTSGLNINGSGTLTLTAYSTYTGPTTVSNGTLNLPTAISGASTSLRSSTINLMPGTALTCVGGAFGWYANNNAMGLTININGATCQPNGAFGVAYTLTGGSLAGSSHRLDLGASGGFNSFITTYPSATTSIINPGDGNVANDLVMLRNDSGQTSYTFTVAAGTTPSGIDLDVQVPIYQNTAPCSLIKAGSGTMQMAGPNAYKGSTTVSNGTLVINGTVNTSALIVKSGATFMTSANLTAGTLTLNPTSTTALVMNRAAGTTTYGSVQGMTTATLGGTLVVTNLGGTFQTGDSFSLFNAASITGNFSTLILPTLSSNQGWSWSPATGVLTVVSASGPTVLTWDANPGTSGTQLDGSGSWDSTTANWWNGTTDVPWAPAAIATFGGGGNGAYSVTLSESINAGGLAFNNGNYTIGNATGAETISLAGSSAGAPQITYNNDTEIDVPLAGTSGLNINGAGILTLTAYSTYTGTTIVSNGTLNLPTPINNGTATSLRSPIINLMPGSTLTCNYSAFGWYANNNAIGLTINVNGASCQPNGSFGVAYTLTGGSIAGGSQRLDLGASGGFNSSITTYSSATTSVINPGDGNVVNDLVMLRNDSGQTNYTFTVAAGTTPSGVDLDIQVPIRQNTAKCSLIKTGAGTLQLSAANIYQGTTTVSNGTLLVNGALSTNIVTVGMGATLGGTGVISGPVIVNGTLDLSLGNLTISNTLTFSKSTNNANTNNGPYIGVGKVYFAPFSITRKIGSPQYTGTFSGITTVTFGGTLEVTNTGGTFQNGDTFRLFSATTYVGDFDAFILPPLNSGLAWSWSPTTGVLSVVPGSIVNPNPTNILATVSSGNLNLTWPMDHIGWRLLTQTNNLSLGVSSNTNDWMTVAGSTATNAVSIPLDATKPGGYYRLVYP